MDDFGDSESLPPKYSSSKNSGADACSDNDGDNTFDADYAASTAKKDKMATNSSVASSAPSKIGKKKRKHGGGHFGGHSKAFRNSKGYELFSRSSPLPSSCEEEDVITNVVGKKPLLGKVWRDKERGDYTRYRCYNYGIEYKPGESVYIDSQRPDQPYYICNIQDLKMSKRDTLMVHIKWYYRTNEVPEQVYQLLIQDRNTEHNHFNRQQHAKRKRQLAAAAAAAAAATSGEGGSADPEESSSQQSSSNSTAETASAEDKPVKLKRLDERMLRMRELFISDATDVYPVSVLRGKCVVHHCQDIKAVKEFMPTKDTFFYTLSYNPETRRLASTQGEIRVGASHQANCPEYLPDVPIEERRKNCHYGEELMWEPGRIHDHDLLMYLRAARSMTAFAAMCDGGSPEDGFTAASRDGITANAIAVLHENDYNTGRALQSLLKCPYPASADVLRTLWSEEDIKDFIKGLRAYGKNFFKIRVEFLPERETSELVELYYFWKKTPGAANNRPRGRRHRPNVLRRIKPGKTGSGSGAGGNDKEFKSRDPDDPSSMSEGEEEDPENQADGDKVSEYYCRHCFTTGSKSWHHAGKEKILVCADCRYYFKCYGEFPCLEPPPPPGTISPELTFNDEDDDADVELDDEDGISVSGGGKTGNVGDSKKLLGGELNLNAIENDSFLNGENPDDEDDSNNAHGSVANISRPVEIKAELTAAKSVGLVSPVPTLPAHQPMQQQQQQQLQSPTQMSQQQHFRRQPLPPGMMPASPMSNMPLSLTTGGGNSLADNYSMHHHQQLQQQLHQMQQQQYQHQLQQQFQNSSQQQQQQQMSPSQRSNPSPQLPTTPREPTPPPKPDNTECHRSQSAIFTRNWNRGEGNSCARTDLFFKPVPDSKLARKREERLRKATAEREQDALKASMSAAAAAAAANDAKMAARLDMAAHLSAAAGHGPPHGPPSMFGDPFAQHAAAAAALGLSFQMGPSQLERMERERREQEMRVSMALAMSIAASPLTVTSSMRSPLAGNPYGPPPHGFSAAAAAQQHNFLAAAAAEGRRYEELAALTRERQYAALATDPLVRLQMAGVNPELPPVHHPAYGLLGPPPGLGPPRGPQTPGPGSYADPRFRSPGGSGDSMMRPGGMSSPGMEMLQRQLLLEREQSIRAAAAAQGAAHASFFAQQDELIRYEQERARHAAAMAASRPP